MDNLSKIDITLYRILTSIALKIKKRYPQYPIHINPSYQGMSIPCFYIQLLTANDILEKEIGTKEGLPIYRYHLDLVINFIQENEEKEKFTKAYGFVDYFLQEFDSIELYDNDEKVYDKLRVYNKSVDNSIESLKVSLSLDFRAVKLVVDEIPNKLKYIIFKLLIGGVEYVTTDKIPVGEQPGNTEVFSTNNKRDARIQEVQQRRFDSSSY